MNLKKSIEKLMFVYIPMDKISKQSKICLSVALTIMTAFFVVQSFIVFGICKPSYEISLFGYACVIFFAAPFGMFVKEFLDVVDTNEKELLKEVLEKNTYLEHAAKILRHDMHSGLNTYIPRGIRSLERRLDADIIKEKKLESPLRLLKEGLAHSQQVYKGVFEFTNLVRKDATLCIEPVDIGDALTRFLKRTSYSDQVLISDDLPCIPVNEALFCTAIDNLIRNGLKYNDNQTKWVKIDMINAETLSVVDNGRGLSSQDFEELCKPYTRRKNQKESGTGLGLNICVAILKEHGFSVSAEKLAEGTMIRIRMDND